MKRENKFQPDVIAACEKKFEGCTVLKNDPNYIQGIPDLTVIYKSKWAWLECKKSENETHQPNQDDYVAYAQENAFGAFIYPENFSEVMNELERYFHHGEE